MKVNLVVATGVHQGKVVPVPGGKLVIGRDPTCHLRPASPAVSKVHCTVTCRDGKAYALDHDSTNGTFVNELPIHGEVELAAGDRLRVGPLDFTVQLAPGSRSDLRPVAADPAKPPATAGSPSDPLGMKPLAATGPARGNAPPPPKTTITEPAPAKAAAPEPAAAPTPPVKPGPAPTLIPRPSPAAGPDPDQMAAQLLADEDGKAPEVPEGSTVMEIPALEMDKIKQTADAAKAAAAKKPVADSSKAADDILKKYRAGRGR